MCGLFRLAFRTFRDVLRAVGTKVFGLGLELENTWHAGHSPTYWTLGVFTVSGTAISVNTDPGCQASPSYL